MNQNANYTCYYKNEYGVGHFNHFDYFIYLKTDTLNVALPGSTVRLASALLNLTVTVLEALTQAKNDVLATPGDAPAPKLTTSPVDAPVTVIVKSE